MDIIYGVVHFVVPILIGILAYNYGVRAERRSIAEFVESQAMNRKAKVKMYKGIMGNLDIPYAG